MEFAMELFEAIKNRRSIRKYSGESVKKEDVKVILESAMTAPSAMNLQAWHFLVADQRDVIDSIITAVSHAEMLRGADTAILVCADESVEKNLIYNIQNTAAAIENLLLAAHGLGLGACWIAVYPLEDAVKKTRELFKLPAHILPVAVISLGRPGEELGGEYRYSEDKVHYNKW